jgi:hypothetical protein
MSKDKKHFDDARLARKRAAEGWGVKEDTLKDAIKSMTPADITSGALLEIVRRINQAISAWASDKDLEEEYDRDQVPVNAVPFPDLKPGDRLYYCSDLDDCLTEQIIISKDDKGFVRLVTLGDAPHQARLWTTWGYGKHKLTAEAAVAAEARNDIEYHARRLKRAQDVLAAIAEGRDFRSLLGDPDEEDDGKVE